MREFRVRSLKPGNHLTGRKCDDKKCEGDLADTVLHSGEKTSDKVMGKALFGTVGTDVQIILGNSMRTEPSTTFPISTKMSGGKVVYVGLQKPSLNFQTMYATLNIYAKADDVMQLLMDKLGMDIPAYKLRRWLFVRLEKNEKD